MKEWNEVVSVLRSNHPQLIRGWFNRLKPATLENGVLSIATENTDQSRYLTQNCSRAFTEAMQEVTGRLISVCFEDTPSDEHATDTLLAEPEQDGLLDPNLTFDTFVMGRANRLALAAAKAVSTNPGETYQPLFIFGDVGLGKTHLLHGVAHELRAARPTWRICYLTCEAWVNLLIEATEKYNVTKFHERFRLVDVLLIDDLQFLAGTESAQEEFFHTFNTLLQYRRQVVLAADRPADQFKGLEERLRSRFTSGLVVRVEPPDFETRAAIVRAKASRHGIPLSDDVANLVAEVVTTNVRSLESALLNLDHTSATLGKPITADFARDVLLAQAPPTVKLPAIMELVAARMDVRIADLQGRKRTRQCTLPRHICIHLARKLTNLSLDEIGGYFGGRDHTTILHADRTVARQLATDAELARTVAEFELLLRASRPNG